MKKIIKIVLNVIKSGLFILFIYSLIKLIPNIYAMGVLGIIFLCITFIYILSLGISYLIKDESVNYDFVRNSMNILIYIYLSFVAYRYVNSVNSSTYIIKDIYFIINYIIAMIGMLGSMFDTLTILNNK